MKWLKIRQYWIDDENHFLKGYFTKEMTIINVNWAKYLYLKIKSLFKRD